jgi:Uncharacterized conserved protein (DUF2183)
MFGPRRRWPRRVPRAMTCTSMCRADLRRRLLAALLWAGCAWGPASAAGLRADEQVLVFPSLAHSLPDGRLAVRVDAWVHERESNRIAAHTLARVLGMDLDELPAAERAVFRERTRLFGTDSQPGRRLQGAVGTVPLSALPASDAFGRIQGSLIQPVPDFAAASAVGASAGVGNGGRMALTLTDGQRRFEGRVHWLAPQGLSVVSDIDDTIKHTQVRQRREMLRNTFARPFVAVPGMAAWYSRMAADAPGAAFHYVSGGPLQLLPPLDAFLADGGFPAGSVHLRSYKRQLDTLFSRGGTARHKHAAITQLLNDHPQRRFILVGDSGEHDPEIYGALARAHPERIAAVLIRDVSGEPADAARYAQAFAGVPPTRWQLFTEPAGLPTRWP